MLCTSMSRCLHATGIHMATVGADAWLLWVGNVLPALACLECPRKCANGLPERAYKTGLLLVLNDEAGGLPGRVNDAKRACWLLLRAGTAQAACPVSASTCAPAVCATDGGPSSPTARRLAPSQRVPCLTLHPDRWRTCRPTSCCILAGCCEAEAHGPMP